MKKLLTAVVLLCSVYGSISAQEPAAKQLPEKQVKDKNQETASDQLPEQRIKDKREGWFFTGVPIIGGNNNDGLCFGAYAEVTNNGKKDGPMWKYSPFIFKMSVSIIASLNGYQFYSLGLDMPRINNSRFSLLARATYRQRDNAGYFGTGSSSHFLTDRNGNTYNTLTEFKSSFLHEGNNAANVKYNLYRLIDPLIYVKAYYDPLSFLRFSLGATCQYAIAETWNGKGFSYSINGLDPPLGYISNDTLFDKLGMPKIQGFINRIQGGIAIDTRDYRPDPQKGVLLSYVFEVSGSWLGSTWEYHRHTADLKLYYTFFKILTFAGHGVFQYNSPETPFFRMGYFGYFEEERLGFGNSRTLRGFANSRFIGNIMCGGSVEVRVQAVKFNIGKELIAIKPLLFVDLARVSNTWFDLSQYHQYLEAGYGGGFVITWNQSTVLHFYLGFSREDVTVSFDVDHAW